MKPLEPPPILSLTKFFAPAKSGGSSSFPRGGKAFVRDNPMHVKREDRIAIEADATVEFGETGQSSAAKSINMTSAGVLLRFDEPVELAAGDRVTCDFLFEHGPDLPLPYWGLGRIVRVDAAGSVAVELHATGLSQHDPHSVVAPVPVLDHL
jgi:hypothetical protein